MAEDISKIRIGRCKVTYGGEELGHTLDGVEVTVEREFTDLSVDAYGSTPIDKALTGQRMQIKARFAQTADIKVLNAAIPEGAQSDQTGTDNDRIGIGREAGWQARNEAYQLVLHPVSLGSNDAEDIVIYKAISVEAINLAYKVDEQNAVEVTFEALVDERFENGRRLGHIGPAEIS